MMLFIVAIAFVVYVYIASCFLKVAITGTKNGEDLYEFALDTYLVEEVISGSRGTIYDKHSEPLAEQMTSYTVYANLYEEHGEVVEDKEKTANQLGEALSISTDDILGRLNKEGAKHVEFGAAGRNLTYLEKQAIEELDLPGIGFTEQVKRLYPNEVFASHTIGYTQFDEELNTIVGYMGLEAYLNEELTGVNGVVEYIKDKRGYIQPNQEMLVLSEVKHGHDYYLTLDATVQTFLEEAMDRVADELEPKSLVAIVANPSTGEIVAMGSRNSFNPNIRDIENYNNPLISQPFEPGSTMKIYTYAAAINEGVYEGSEMFTSGSRQVNEATINDYNKTWGTISYDEGFYRSSNTAVVDLLEKVAPDTTIDYFKAFGFGSDVGIELPDEYSGTLPSESDQFQQITAGFGQGIMTTPLQHIQAITAILNEGQLIKPQLIDRIYDPNKEMFIQTYEKELLGMPITASTANQVKDLMIGVIEDPTGSGSSYVLDHFTSGGKTGTAQIAEGANGYLTGSNDYVYSYMGFAPAEEPELVMYVAIDRPKKGGHAELGELYRYVMDNSLSYLGATKTPVLEFESEQEQVTVPNLLNQDVSKAIELVKSQTLRPIVLGDGKRIFSQAPSANRELLQNEKVFLMTDTTFELPDFTNYSKNDMMTFKTLTGLDIEIVGDGLVVSQSIEPKTLVSQDTSVQVELSIEAKEAKE